MIPVPRFEVEDTLTSAIRQLMDSRERNKGLGDAIDEAMQYWLSFIINKQMAADRAGIRSYLMARADRAGGGAPTRKRTRAGKISKASRYLELRQSRAAAIVWHSNYKGARSLAPGQFYPLVGNYISRRQYASGYHKGSFIPALNAFKMKRGVVGQVPNYKHPAGFARAARAITDTLMEARVVNTAAGILKNPTGGQAAVDASRAEVEALFATFVLRNIKERARRLGLAEG